MKIFSRTTISLTLAASSVCSTCRVTAWAMFGPNLFVSKVMGLFVDIDKMVGKDFEAGLAALKHNAEEAPR